MNALSVTFNGEDINPEQYLPSDIYDITSLLLSELDGRLGYPISDREVVDLHSHLNNLIVNFDSNFYLNGAIDSYYDGNLDSVTVPVLNGRNDNTFTVTLKWSRRNMPLKVMIYD